MCPAPRALPFRLLAPTRSILLENGFPIPKFAPARAAAHFLIFLPRHRTLGKFFAFILLTILSMQLNSTIPADGMFNEVTIYDVMNTTGGYLCYVYE